MCESIPSETCRRPGTRRLKDKPAGVVRDSRFGTVAQNTFRSISSVGERCQTIGTRIRMSWLLKENKATRSHLQLPAIEAMLEANASPYTQYLAPHRVFVALGRRSRSKSDA